MRPLSVAGAARPLPLLLLEYFVWQVGVFALRDLEIAGFSATGADNVTCFNLGEY